MRPHAFIPSQVISTDRTLYSVDLSLQRYLRPHAMIAYCLFVSRSPIYYNYSLHFYFHGCSSSVLLQVNDYYLLGSPQTSESVVAAFSEKVHLEMDRMGDPGWNLQDLLNVTRKFDEDLTYYGNSGRMIQNYW